MFKGCGISTSHGDLAYHLLHSTLVLGNHNTSSPIGEIPGDSVDVLWIVDCYFSSLSGNGLATSRNHGDALTYAKIGKTSVCLTHNNRKMYVATVVVKMPKPAYLVKGTANMRLG